MCLFGGGGITPTPPKPPEPLPLGMEIDMARMQVDVETARLIAELRSMLWFIQLYLAIGLCAFPIWLLKQLFS